MFNNFVQVVTGAFWWVNILYSLLNLVLFPMLGLYCLYVGFYGLMKRPRVTYHLYYYWAVQGVLCFCWFLFAIWPVGPWNGFSKAIIMGKQDRNNGFAIFLTIVETLMHVVLFLLGVGLIAVSVLLKNKPPTDQAAQELPGASELDNQV